MKRQNKKSILIKVLAAMLTVAIIQTSVFYCMIMFRGTMRNLNAGSAVNFQNIVSTRADNIQHEMVSYWAGMGSFEAVFRNEFDKLLKKNKITYQDFNEDSQYQNQFILEMMPELIQMLRQNKVNGAFMILNGSADITRPEEGEFQTKQGISIRDMDPNSGYMDNADLFLERASASILPRLNISLDSGWKAAYTFSQEDQSDFYYKPLEAAADRRDGWRNLAYWAPLHKISENDVNVISYSIPLRDNNGNIIGVAGVEILESYLCDKLPVKELDKNNKGEYVIAMGEQEESSYRIMAQEGYTYHVNIKPGSLLHFNKNSTGSTGGLYILKEDKNTFAGMQPIRLYDNGAYFENDQWYVIGILNRENLFAFSTEIKNILYTSIFISLMIALFGGILLSNRLVRPIRKLSMHINRVRPEENLSLPRTDIEEIDQLVTEIEQLQNNVLENNRKLSMIIRLSGLPIGAFEIDFKDKTVYFTDQFFRIMNYEVISGEEEELKNFDRFIEKIKLQRKAVIKEEEHGNKQVITYYFKDSGDREKWVRTQTVRTGEKLIGTVLDVSKEFMEKVKLEHERDHDLLTNLYNRRAFHSKMKEVFAKPESLGTAAMIMIDLDNLKYINDSYGHDCGDRYIKAAANALEQCMDDRMFIARMSGDEFNLLLYHYHDIEEIREKIKSIHEHTSNRTFHAVREKLYIRMTGGVAFYGKDSSEYLELIQFADFAMYQAKRSSKGEYREFNREEYARDSFLLKNRGELNTILEKEQIEYHFQPIVNVRDGSVYAFEALMRPMGKVIRRPDEMLALSKTQGRLYHIERLTWRIALRDFNQNKVLKESGCKLFVNSISSQVMTKDDINYIEEHYKDLLSRVVLELTEEERLNNEFTQTKLNCLKEWKAGLALDDFGSGYNGENLLLSLNPNYIKVDMNIIRDIDKDLKRQNLFNNLVNYAAGHQIKVIAEGVETEEEFYYVKEHGADFVQGYLLGKPERDPGTECAVIFKLLNEKQSTG